MSGYDNAGYFEVMGCGILAVIAVLIIVGRILKGAGK